MFTLSVANTIYPAHIIAFLCRESVVSFLIRQNSLPGTFILKVTIVMRVSKCPHLYIGASPAYLCAKVSSECRGDLAFFVLRVISFSMCARTMVTEYVDLPFWIFLHDLGDFGVEPGRI